MTMSLPRLFLCLAVALFLAAGVGTIAAAQSTATGQAAGTDLTDTSAATKAKTKAKTKARRGKAARPSGGYDGLWGVLIVTDAGPCDRAYRYSVQIARGVVRNAGGDGFFNVYGRVSPNGGISVRVSSGGQSANGSGRLGARSGGGRWRSAGGECYGRWSASRR